MNQLKILLILLMALGLSATSISQDLILPDDFPSYTIDQLVDPDPAYLFIFPRPQKPAKFPGYLSILDNHGTPVFYRYLPHQSGQFKVQPSGLISYLRKEGAVNQFYMMDSSFRTVDSVWMENYILDTHDFIAMENGHFLIFGLDLRTVDMSLIVDSGQVDATVKGCVIQELDADKNVVFEWNSFDHFQITDCYKDLSASSIDYVHPNSLEIDADGNILLISRAMNEITKISRQTGDIIWRLGGKNNQFTFADTTDMFSRPHSFRRLAETGHYTLFDNGTSRDPSYSRGIEYLIDQENKTIAKVWEYDADKAVFAPSGGSTQRLASGTTIMCYGGQVSSPSVTEVHPDGTVAFNLSFDSLNIRAGNVVKQAWQTTLFSSNTSSVNFGEWDGYTESIYLLKIKNNSESDLELSNHHLHTDAFYFNAGLFPLILAPGEEKSLDLYYYPENIESAEVKDILTINSDINSDTLIQRVAIQVKLRGTKLYESIEGHAANPIRVYPSPAKEWVTISSPKALNGNFTIHSMNGSLIYEGVFAGTESTVDLGEFESGVYLIEISDEASQSIYRTKLVKL